MQQMPRLTAPAFAELMSTLPPPSLALRAEPPAPGAANRAAPVIPARVLHAGDPVRGRLALAQYACIACHIIPGITGPRIYVGPPLREISERKYIAGLVPNTRSNLVRWILNPSHIDPLTAMPDHGVTEADAIDIAAYLSTL